MAPLAITSLLDLATALYQIMAQNAAQQPALGAEWNGTDSSNPWTQLRCGLECLILNEQQIAALEAMNRQIPQP